MAGAVAMRSIMGVFARELDRYTDLMTQIFLRGLLGTLLLALFCYQFVDFKKFRDLERHEVRNLCARAIAMFVIGVALGSYAFIHGNYITATLVLALPTTAIISRVIYRESMSPATSSCVCLSFIGALIIILQKPQALAPDWALVCALIAALSMSWGILAARRQSTKLTNIEATLFMMTVATALCGCLSLASIFVMGQVPRTSPDALILSALGGVSAVTFILMSDYAAPKLHGAAINNILALQPFFGAIVGYTIYDDGLSVYDLLGGGLIMTSTFLLANKQTL